MFSIAFIFTMVFHSQSATMYQVQGDYRQTTQLTQRVKVIEPSMGDTQSNYQDSDTLQPVLGYDSLTQGTQGITL